MIDFHCHFLPGVDDGVATRQEAVMHLLRSYEEGLRQVVLTPHIFPGLYNNSRSQLMAEIDRLRQELELNNSPLEIVYGSEVFLDENLLDNLEKGNLLTIGDGEKYLLVEFPYQDYPGYADGVLFQLQCRGITPIVAHPERNYEIRKDRQKVLKLLEQGILFQLDAGSLLGKYGRETQLFAENLVAHRMVQLLGSDYHKANDGIYSTAANRVEALTDAGYRKKIVLDFPAAVLSQKPISVEYLQEKKEHKVKFWSLWNRKTA